MKNTKKRKRYFIHRNSHKDRSASVLESSGMLNEMAIPRKQYFEMALNQSKPVLAHIGKICVLGNLDSFRGYVSHWEDEIGTQIYDLGRIDVDNDDKQCKIKKKAFTQSFIEGRLGRNFSEYDQKMYSYFVDGLEDEFKDEIAKDKNFLSDYLKKNNIDLQEVVLQNKDRIRDYLESFVPLLSIKDIMKLKDEAKKKAHSF